MDGGAAGGRTAGNGGKIGGGKAVNDGLDVEPEVPLDWNDYFIDLAVMEPGLDINAMAGMR